MGARRFFRYLAPNLVTMASLLFGMLSIASSLGGRWAAAAWFVVFSVLTDKLDGFVARLVKGTSEFGVQLDSFADFLNFGIAPATLFYAFLTQDGSPMGEGRAYWAVVLSSVLWVLAVTFRLARYNLVGDDPRCKRIFFGVPTTLMGGFLATLFLTLLKYGDPATASSFQEPRLLGGGQVGPGVWKAWPALMAMGAFAMASSLKVPKLGLARSRPLTIFIFANVFAGYAFGASRLFPEYLCFDASVWILASLIWGAFNKDLRGLRPPPIFPREDRPAGQAPLRPEDQFPEDDEEPQEAAPAAEAEPARTARG